MSAEPPAQMAVLGPASAVGDAVQVTTKSRWPALPVVVEMAAANPAEMGRPVTAGVGLAVPLAVPAVAERFVAKHSLIAASLTARR